MRSNVSERREAGIPPSSERGPSGPRRRLYGTARDVIIGMQFATLEGKLVQSGGIYVNNRRISDVQARLTRDQAIDGRLFVLRKGQKQNHLVRLE